MKKAHRLGRIQTLYIMITMRVLYRLATTVATRAGNAHLNFEVR